MSEIVARCGFRCDHCMAFAGNNHSHEDKEKVAAAWSKYFGLKIAADGIKCNGCRNETHAGGELPEALCGISACVVGREMNTCADCFDFPCEKIESRLSGIEEVILRFRDKVSKAEFDAYLAPYDARKILNEIRDRRIDRID